jgi:hypothetical protein
MSKHLCIHGNAALSDGNIPHKVVVSPTVDGGHIAPPPGLSASSFPYHGMIHLLFQNPPMGPSPTFDITELHLKGRTHLAHLDRVDLYSGASNIFTRSTPLFPDTTLWSTTFNVDDRRCQMEGDAGLDFTVIITFNSNLSYAIIEAASIKYN